MSLDMAGITRACNVQGLDVKGARHLCRSEIDTFRREAASGRLMVACTQEQPLFTQIAEDEGLSAELSFVNIRERAGWSTGAKNATAKIAALLALGADKPEPTPFVTFESEGVALVLGCDEVALQVAQALAGTLDITVLLAPKTGGGDLDIAPLRASEFPVRRGVVRSAKGRLR
jgi:heterodisulfide reductase subunit A-like polyferredoxin